MEKIAYSMPSQEFLYICNNCGDRVKQPEGDEVKKMVGKRLGRVKITNVYTIKMEYAPTIEFNILREGDYDGGWVMVHPDVVDMIYKADGFESVYDFAEFFSKNYDLENQPFQVIEFEWVEKYYNQELFV